MALKRAFPAPKSATFKEQQRHRLMLPAVLIGMLTGFTRIAANDLGYC